MTDILLKHSLLDKSAQQEISDFVDYLLSKKRVQKTTPLADYKKKILSVSTWSEEDLKNFDDNHYLFNLRKINEW